MSIFTHFWCEKLAFTPRFAQDVCMTHKLLCKMQLCHGSCLMRSILPHYLKSRTNFNFTVGVDGGKFSRQKKLTYFFVS